MTISREKTIIRTSIIGILANLILAGFKAVVGLLSNSIAIVTDAINNLSDALSNIVTIVGIKFANKAPDREHPYGYGRIEYMTSFIVSSLVLYAGITALVESIKKIIFPEATEYDTVTLIVLGAAVVVKLILGEYAKHKGRLANSTALVASGTDAFSDAILTTSVLASAVVHMIFHVSLEAYIGVLLALFIIYSGIKLIKESINNMLGVRIESKLSKKIKKEVTREPEVEGAFDLVLHDYGPERYLGSVHIEVEDTLTVADVDRISRRISKNVFKKYGVILHTIGVYSVNTKDKNIIAAREAIKEIVFSHSGVLQMHGFYLDPENHSITFDIIIDFKVKDREALYAEIYDEIKQKYPDYQVNITLDIDAGD